MYTMYTNMYFVHHRVLYTSQCVQYVQCYDINDVRDVKILTP